MAAVAGAIVCGGIAAAFAVAVVVNEQPAVLGGTVAFVFTAMALWILSSLWEQPPQ